MPLALRCINEEDIKSAGMEIPENNHSEAQQA